MRFANPYYLTFLVFIPVYLLLRKYFRREGAALVYSSLGILGRSADFWTKNRDIILLWSRLAAVALIVLALSRPQAGTFSEEVSTEGVDIILCLDTSSSMQAEDFKPRNRLDAAKETAKKFVQGRKHDRIGVVVFAGLSFTQCPLTLDHGAVLDLISKVEIGMTSIDMTAIGSAIATSVNRLRTSEAKSKVIILLSDGRNNYGEIDPLTAAKTAQALGIKIYTIGAGAPGGAMYPVDDPAFGRRYVKIPEQELDEVSLRKMADMTGGTYFRAASTGGLEEIFRRIDRLEKVKLKVKEYTEYRDFYLFFLLPAFALLLLEQALAGTVLLKIP